MDNKELFKYSVLFWAAFLGIIGLFLIWSQDSLLDSLVVWLFLVIVGSLFYGTLTAGVIIVVPYVHKKIKIKYFNDSNKSKMSMPRNQLKRRSVFLAMSNFIQTLFSKENIEFKRTCNHCNKTWFVSQQEIKELTKAMGRSKFKDSAVMFAAPALSGGTGTASAILAKQLNDLKKCPNCQSTNYRETKIPLSTGTH